ncbi:MAG TPA: PadR family transcriptional regulator [Candidatus Polarisedimenticolia bacterium]|nr:PadR family transcriptional regulator [Candidatus Polarisedimenticolia bacterium]
MAPTRTDRLQGHLDLLILRALAGGPMHGWAVAQRLDMISRSVLQVGQGSIYPALRRLENESWITAEWGISEAGRRARFYRLTPAGRRQLERERALWNELAEAIQRVLEMA